MVSDNYSTLPKVFGPDLKSASIPEKFFGILTSPNKELYVWTLLEIRSLFNRSMEMTKDDLVLELSVKLEKLLYPAELAEEPDGVDLVQETARNSREKASVIVNRLIRRGWLNTEMESKESVRCMVTMPFHAHETIECINNIIHPPKVGFSHYSYAIYSALKGVDDSAEYRYLAIVDSNEHTEAFNKAVTELYLNIGLYYEGIRVSDSNAMVKTLLDDYQENILKHIGVLLVKDCISKFRTFIITTLQNWQESEEIMKGIVESGMIHGNYDSKLDCLNDINRMINYIIDTYNTMPRKINLVEHKNNAYVKAVAESISYQTNTARDISGLVQQILRRSEEPGVADMMADALVVGSTRHVSSDSLSSRLVDQKREAPVPEPFEFKAPPQDLIEAQNDIFSAVYTDEKIDAYIEENLAAGHFTSRSFKLENDDDFILLILATIRAQDFNSIYKVDFPKDEQIIRGNYRIPLISFSVDEEKRSKLEGGEHKI